MADKLTPTSNGTGPTWKSLWGTLYNETVMSPQTQPKQLKDTMSPHMDEKQSHKDDKEKDAVPGTGSSLPVRAVGWVFSNIKFVLSPLNPFGKGAVKKDDSTKQV